MPAMRAQLANRLTLAARALHAQADLPRPESLALAVRRHDDEVPALVDSTGNAHSLSSPYPANLAVEQRIAVAEFIERGARWLLDACGERLVERYEYSFDRRAVADRRGRPA